MKAPNKDVFLCRSCYYTLGTKAKAGSTPKDPKQTKLKTVPKPKPTDSDLANQADKLVQAATGKKSVTFGDATAAKPTPAGSSAPTQAPKSVKRPAAQASNDENVPKKPKICTNVLYLDNFAIPTVDLMKDSYDLEATNAETEKLSASIRIQKHVENVISGRRLAAVAPVINLMTQIHEKNRNAITQMTKAQKKGRVF